MAATPTPPPSVTSSMDSLMPSAAKFVELFKKNISVIISIITGVLLNFVVALHPDGEPAWMVLVMLVLLFVAVVVVEHGLRWYVAWVERSSTEWAGSWMYGMFMAQSVMIILITQYASLLLRNQWRRENLSTTESIVLSVALLMALITGIQYMSAVARQDEVRDAIRRRVERHLELQMQHRVGVDAPADSGRCARCMGETYAWLCHQTPTKFSQHIDLHHLSVAHMAGVHGM